MTMMPPTLVMVVAAASAPTVMMAMTAVPHMAVTVTVAAPDLDDGSISGAESGWRCDGHCRRKQGWGQRKSAGGKSDQQEPFHFSVSSIEFA